ncbi:MAG: shikimate dehydrogenase [Oscillospiraceae bacterium]|nr:shikimate dehydrogenase [Oscillospiraceae bacterium]
MEKNYRAELTGVFGDPVEGNPTGVMEEAAYEALGLNFRYITMKVTPDGFPDAMKAVRAIHMKGVNLTMPHKIKVLPYLDELSPAAKIIGAVNTVVVREDGTLFGENTDGKGFVEALLRCGESPEGKNIVILGAGGAARAIAVECALAGARKITVVNRTAQRARELADLIRSETACEAVAAGWEAGQGIPQDTDILINATSIGLGEDRANRPDIDYDTIRPGMTVSDVVFNPSNTLFLQAAAERGAKTVNGLGMLACQGARNFTLWTGRDAPLSVMIDKLKEEFGEGQDTSL